MKKYTIALSLFAAFLAVGCSDKNKDKPASASAAAAAPAAPAVKLSSLSKDAPAEMKGGAFEKAGNCSIDSVNNALVNGAEVAISRADGLTVDGWALDESSAVVAPIVALQLEKGGERYFALLNRHAGRDDLIKGYGKPEYTNAGIVAPVDIAALPAGQYDMSIVQKAGGKNLVCAANRKLNLKD